MSMLLMASLASAQNSWLRNIMPTITDKWQLGNVTYRWNNGTFAGNVTGQQFLGLHSCKQIVDNTTDVCTAAGGGTNNASISKYINDTGVPATSITGASWGGTPNSSISKYINDTGAAVWDNLDSPPAVWGRGNTSGEITAVAVSKTSDVTKSGYLIITTTHTTALFVQSALGAMVLIADTTNQLLWTATLKANTDNLHNIGAPDGRYKDLYLSGKITDNTNNITALQMKQAYDYTINGTFLTTETSNASTSMYINATGVPFASITGDITTTKNITTTDSMIIDHNDTGMWWGDEQNAYAIFNSSSKCLEFHIKENTTVLAVCP